MRDLDEQGILDARVAKYIMEDNELLFHQKKRKKKMRKITFGDKNVKEAEDLQVQEKIKKTINRLSIKFIFIFLKYSY